MIAYPYNLIVEVYGHCRGKDGNGEWLTATLTEDNLRGFEHALSLVPQKERLAIESHYRDGMTYRVMAEQLGMTVEGVRQLVLRGQRKLRHPELARYVFKGFIRASAESRKTAEINALRDDQNITANSSVWKLNLSTRALNCMMRNGIGDVGRLASLSMDELLGLRNMGIKTANEVWNKLVELGFK